LSEYGDYVPAEIFRSRLVDDLTQSTAHLSVHPVGWRPVVVVQYLMGGDHAGILGKEPDTRVGWETLHYSLEGVFQSCCSPNQILLVVTGGGG
jgi:hypothetical protein